MAGKVAFGTNAAYVASKHGMVGFAVSIFEDVREYNVVTATRIDFAPMSGELDFGYETQETLACLQALRARIYAEQRA